MEPYLTIADFKIGCFRRLLSVMCTHSITKKALSLTRTEVDRADFDCKPLHHKASTSLRQHFLMEAPVFVPAATPLMRALS